MRAVSSSLLERIVAVSVVLGGMFASACLVTNNVDYDLPNVPAHIEKIAPLGFPRVVTMDPDPGCTPNEPMAFQFKVSDPNGRSDLRARIIVNGTLGATKTLTKLREEATGDVVQLCAKKNQLTADCNYVEVLISSEFADQSSGSEDPRAPAEPGDLSRIDWLVMGDSADAPQANNLDCSEILDELFDAGVP